MRRRRRTVLPKPSPPHQDHRHNGRRFGQLAQIEWGTPLHRPVIPTAWVQESPDLQHSSAR